MTKNWIDEVKFNSNGLVPVVTQDFESGRVLMLAWANAEALHEAQVTGRGVYFSRSRGKLWRKGEESGIQAGNCVVTSTGVLAGVVSEVGSHYCVVSTVVDTSMEMGGIITRTSMSKALAYMVWGGDAV